MFLISVIGEQGSCNRYFADAMLDLINSSKSFNTDYTVKRHDGIASVNLYDSLDEAIHGDDYEGYIIILDTLDASRGLFNPNVMFEFGAVKNLEKPFAVMSTEINGPETWPFDVKALNITRIPRVVTDYINDCFKDKKAPNIQDWLFDMTAEVKTEINQFFVLLKKTMSAHFCRRSAIGNMWIQLLTSWMD